MSPSPTDLGALSEGYARRGFAVGRGLLDAGAVAAAAEALDARWRTGLGDLAELVLTRPTVDGDEVPDRIDPVARLLPEVHRLLAAPELSAAVAAVLGRDDGWFKDRYIRKAPGTCGYHLHQDLAWWQCLRTDAGSVVSALIALEPADVGNGTLVVHPGTHRRLHSAPGAEVDVDPAAVADVPPEAVELAVGDVLLLHPLVVHASPPNRSDRGRPMLAGAYSSHSSAVLRERYYRHHGRIHAHERYAAAGPVAANSAGRPGVAR